jgi:hypothetical protein
MRPLETTAYTERYSGRTIFLSWANLSPSKRWRAEVLGNERSFYDRTYELALARAKRSIDHSVCEDDFSFVRDLTSDDTRGLWTLAGVGISIGLLALLAFAMKPKPSTP